MHLVSTDLPGVFGLTPRRHGDARGFFAETFNHAALSAAGLVLPPFVEEDQWAGARAGGGALCMPQYQTPPRVRGRLLRCAAGCARVVVTEGRADVPGYKRSVLLTISAADGGQIWVPAGRVAGWIALCGQTIIASNATQYLDPALSGHLAWDSMGVDWDLPAGVQPNHIDDGVALQKLAQWASPFTSGDCA